jgi:hypothetical protein
MTTAHEYQLAISEEERAELLRLLEREIGDVRVESRRTDTPTFHDQLRDEEALLRRLAAKLRQLVS